MKWLWRFAFEEETLTMINENIGLSNEWCTNLRSEPHEMWKCIRSQWPLFAENIVYKVGNGRNVSLWHDNWLTHSPLKEQYPILFIWHKILILVWQRVRTKLIVMFRRNFNDWEIGSMTNFFNVLGSSRYFSDGSDQLSCKAKNKDIFTVKSIQF